MLQHTQRYFLCQKTEVKSTFIYLSKLLLFPKTLISFMKNRSILLVRPRWRLNGRIEKKVFRKQNLRLGKCFCIAQPLQRPSVNSTLPERDNLFINFSNTSYIEVTGLPFVKQISCLMRANLTSMNPLGTGT